MPAPAFAGYLGLLPAALQADVMKYHQYADRIRTLTGKLLLREAMTTAGLPHDLLHSMSYTHYKRPFISSEADFNITHSGHCVACVAGAGMRVGIDVEEIKPIKPDDINAVLRDEELQEMRATNASPETILRFWTRKEAIVKASGEGLYLPPQSIFFLDELTAKTPEYTWYLHELGFGSGYVAYCVSNLPGCSVTVRRVDW